MFSSRRDPCLSLGAWNKSEPVIFFLATTIVKYRLDAVPLLHKSLECVNKRKQKGVSVRLGRTLRSFWHATKGEKNKNAPFARTQESVPACTSPMLYNQPREQKCHISSYNNARNCIDVRHSLVQDENRHLYTKVSGPHDNGE